MAIFRFHFFKSREQASATQTSADGTLATTLGPDMGSRGTAPPCDASASSPHGTPVSTFCALPLTPRSLFCPRACLPADLPACLPSAAYLPSSSHHRLIRSHPRPIQLLPSAVRSCEAALASRAVPYDHGRVAVHLPGGKEGRHRTHQSPGVWALASRARLRSVSGWSSRLLMPYRMHTPIFCENVYL